MIIFTKSLDKKLSTILVQVNVWSQIFKINLCLMAIFRNCLDLRYDECTKVFPHTLNFLVNISTRVSIENFKEVDALWLKHVFRCYFKSCGYLDIGLYTTEIWYFEITLIFLYNAISRKYQGQAYVNWFLFSSSK